MGPVKTVLNIPNINWYCSTVIKSWLRLSLIFMSLQNECLLYLHVNLTSSRNILWCKSFLCDLWRRCEECKGSVRVIIPTEVSLFLLRTSRRKYNVSDSKRQTCIQLLLFSRWQAWKLGKKSLPLTVTWFFCAPSVKWIVSWKCVWTAESPCGFLWALSHGSKLLCLWGNSYKLQLKWIVKDQWNFRQHCCKVTLNAVCNLTL